MQPAPQSGRFENYTLDLRAGELHKSGHKIKLQEQPLLILAMLLEHPGEVVSREELRQRLWPRDTFVDFDHSLNTAIRKLRQALNDEADEPNFIETIPRRGYRFVGALAEVPPVPRTATLPASALVGCVFVLRSAEGTNFVCVPVDLGTLQEKKKLEAAGDDLGISLLCASGRILLLQAGTRVRVLEARPADSCYEVRIVDGEQTGGVALVPGDCLGEFR
jgi:DNA-binding winged helix-turn-helix (wHTH) protein